MGFHSFDTLAGLAPEQLSPELLERYRQGGVAGVNIDDTALFEFTARLGLIRGIGKSCRIQSHSVLGDGVKLGDYVNLDRKA